MEATGGIYNNTVMGTYHWGANCSADSPPPPGEGCYFLVLVGLFSFSWD
eukprot:SAG31_NODE_1161_length_9593_cov_3.825629_8_plen_49_part_00